ncbi:MAG: M15 family metallopeptidase [Bacteroidetes bacterium]|nr:M15 family metallopeptidase [Bacteroidota bacterium]MDA1268166.1 M15 family metallopeptidase [Bacteroidota bacterium]
MKNLSYLLLGLILACSAPKNEGKMGPEGNADSLQKDKNPSQDALDQSLPALEKILLEQGLVDIVQVIPGIQVELKYSTEDNFFQQDVYGDLGRCYLQPVAAEMLAKAQKALQEKSPNLSLLVYDGVRPIRVQQILWDGLEKPDSLKTLYVSDPKIGGLHNFGVAVDLTIVDLKTGKPLDMGTPFDFFGYPAYPDRELQMLAEKKITKSQVANREILRKVMKGAGFTGIDSEWWHFNAFSRKEAGEKFPLIQ